MGTPLMRGLHAGRARGLQRPPRVVEPDVDPAHQEAGDAHVVVLDDEDPAAQPIRPRQLEDALDDAAGPGRSAGCALPAITIWTGRSVVGQDARQPLLVAEEEVGPLVGREPPGEADGQRLRVEDARAPRAGRRATRRGARTGAPAGRSMKSVSSRFCCMCAAHRSSSSIALQRRRATRGPARSSPRDAPMRALARAGAPAGRARSGRGRRW